MYIFFPWFPSEQLSDLKPSTHLQPRIVHLGKNVRKKGYPLTKRHLLNQRAKAQLLLTKLRGLI